MQIHLDPRNFRFTTPIRQYVSQKMESLGDLADILAAHVVLSHNPSENPEKQYTIKAHLAVPGPDIHAKQTGQDIYSTLNKVSSQLARQLRKRHTALIDKRRQKVQRTVEMEKRMGA
jgi:putative sigma-54 modulation protein